jgi:hypothetical protein
LVDDVAEDDFLEVVFVVMIGEGTSAMDSEMSSSEGASASAARDIFERVNLETFHL